MNHRSTANIVQFAQAFREETVLASDSLPKTVRPPAGAPRETRCASSKANGKPLCRRSPRRRTRSVPGGCPNQGPSLPDGRAAHGLDV